MLSIAARAQGEPTRLVGLTWIEESQLILSDGSARGLTLVSSRNPGTIASIF